MLSSKNTLVLIYPISEQGWNVPELYFYNKYEWGETILYPPQYGTKGKKIVNLF